MLSQKNTFATHFLESLTYYNIHCMKKKITYFLFLLLQLISCSNEELLQEHEKASPILFTSHCIEVSTKTNHTVFLAQNSPISLFSIQHPEDYTVNSWTPMLFNNTQGITDANGDILYDNTYYFPIGDQLDFSQFTPLYQPPTRALITMVPNQPLSPLKTTQPINTTSCMPLY